MATDYRCPHTVEGVYCKACEFYGHPPYCGRCQVSHWGPCRARKDN